MAAIGRTETFRINHPDNAKSVNDMTARCMDIGMLVSPTSCANRGERRCCHRESEASSP
jgi:hypothetical protein